MEKKIKDILMEGRERAVVDGWWHGRAYIADSVTEDDLTSFFNIEELHECVRQLILSAHSCYDENQENAAPVSMLNDFSKEQILKQIMDGNLFGEIMDGFGRSLCWEWDPLFKLGGIEVEFDDLSDSSREHIAKEMLDGCYCGKIFEYIDLHPHKYV